MSDPIWAIVPVLAGPEMTEACLADLLAQSIPTRILIVNQGVEDDFRRRLERLAEEYPERICVWSHNPPLPSLAATWNRALQFVWESGGLEACVVNNDTRMHRGTVRTLSTVLRLTKALFVTAVGVTTEQFKSDVATGDLYMGAGIEWDSTGLHVIDPETGITSLEHLQKGGPDFSCYLISREAHEKYPFDEMFTPAFCEDLDTHRRYILGGDGDKIFSINLPYLHLSSQTLKQVSPEKRAALEQAISRGSRAHYERKWGGSGVNHERYTIPFDPASDQDGVTTPELQAKVLAATSSSDQTVASP